jgi:hypothetical protein
MSDYRPIGHNATGNIEYRDEWPETERLHAVVKRAVERMLAHYWLQGSVDELLPWLLAPTDDHNLLPKVDRGIRKIKPRSRP